MSNSGENFQISLRMLSDWHVGTGAGRPGSVDKLIARDADGFPFVPAKTLNGIWRDAVETLTLALDNVAKGEKDQTQFEWQKFVELIFGIQPNQIDAKELAKRLANDEDTYSFSLLSVQPALLDQRLREKINSFGANDRQRFLSSLTFIKPGVAIDGETGTSKRDFLRFEEMGRSGTVLESACELNFENLANVNGEWIRTIEALLVASAKLVERIGGKRRRGAGRCEFKVEGLMSDQEAIAHLQGFKDSPPVAAKFKASSNESYDLNKTPPTAGWQQIEYSLKLQSPVSVATATLGNVSESLDFIPGTYLLPHFGKALRKKIGIGFFNAVAYGDFQISPATIEIEVKDGNQIIKKRGLPVPRVLAQEKLAGGFDKIKENGTNTNYNKLDEPLDEKPQTKNLRSGYISDLGVNGRLPIFKSAHKTLLMHNVIEDELQRPTEAVGGVFSRQAIPAGTTLRGEIRLRNALANQLGINWWKGFDGDTLRLGTSRKDDYGRADLFTWLEEETPANQDLDRKKEAKGSRPRLTVYLESDVLLRNGSLRQSNLIDDLKAELEKTLGHNSLAIPKPDKELATSLIQTRRIESWQERWGFPRPTLIAMAGGSCVRFEVATENLNEAALKRLESEGIGERRGEGYGRIRFNPTLLTEKINKWSPTEVLDEEKVESESPKEALPPEEFVKQIEEVVWREEVKIAVLKIASSRSLRSDIFGFEIEGKGSNKRSVPPMSQIGGLRSVISRVQRFRDAEIVSSWVGRLKETENRRKRWSEDKKFAEDKLDRISKLFQNKEDVWRVLPEAVVDGRPVWQKPETLSHRDLQKDEELWAEAVRSLFDACARAHNRDLEKESKRDGAKN